MANDVTKVTAAKPKVGGAVYVAPLGTTEPKDAKEELNANFKSLGYCSEDGLTNSNKLESSNQKAWGGMIVLNMQTSKEDSFKFKLIESLNVDVLKTVYGNDNVAGSLETGLEISATNDEPEEFVWVFEMILKGNILKRILIHSAAITEIGDIVYKDSEAVGYECTISATQKQIEGTEKEETHHEFIVKKQSENVEEDKS